MGKRKEDPLERLIYEYNLLFSVLVILIEYKIAIIFK